MGLPEQTDFMDVRSFLQGCAERRQVPGGVFALVTPEGAEHFCFGRRSLVPEEEPMTEDAVFDLASLTKVVSTTTIALQCLEKGFFSLQTDVREFLPDFPLEGVTVGGLMTHSSGVCSDDKSYKRCRGKAEMKAFIYGLPAEFSPGQQVKYSDFGYVLLGWILEELVGDLESYGREHIFSLLGMRDTCFNPGKKGLAHRCVPTERTGDRGIICAEVHDGKAWRLGGVSGNAGLFAPAADLERFVRMLLNGGELEGARILSPSTMRLLQKCYTEGLSQRRTLGWICSDREALPGDYCSERCLFHTGFTGTSIYVDFARRCGVILLTNRIHPERDNRHIFEIRRRAHNLALLDADNQKRKEGAEWP